MDKAIQKWASLRTRVSDAIVFVPEDWKTTEGRRCREQLEALLAEADALNEEYKYIVRFEFEPYVKNEVHTIKENWAVIDAEAAAAPPTTTVADLSSIAAAPPVATISTQKHTNKRRKGATRKGKKKKQPVPDLGILGPDGTLDDGTKLGKIFPPTPCEQCETPPRRTCTGQLGVTCDECQLQQLGCSFNNSAARGWTRSTREGTAAAAGNLADAPGAEERLTVTATSPDQVLQRELSHDDTASASASASVSVPSPPSAIANEDVQMTDIDPDKQMTSQSPVHISHGGEPSGANPLEAIRHLSINPEGLRPIPDRSLLTVFNVPATMVDIQQRLEVIRTDRIMQTAASVKALEVFSAESKKEAKLAAEETFLCSLVSRDEGHLS